MELLILGSWIYGGANSKGTELGIDHWIRMSFDQGSKDPEVQILLLKVGHVDPTMVFSPGLGTTIEQGNRIIQLHCV